MEMQNEKYLPLGTICLLNGGERFVMIDGYLGIGNEDANKIYDYIGVVYPIGAISSDMSLMFNHEQINKVIFRGFESDECKDFLSDIKNVSKEDLLKKMAEEQNSTQNTSKNVAPEVVTFASNSSLNETAPEVYNNPQ